MLTDVDGIRVGHWSDMTARTGCTVVLFPEGTVASGEVRGGAPATREMALLDPLATVERVDAAVLTGRSAFGLACTDGVVRWCEERGIGFPTPGGPVPIVPALGIYDLTEGDPRVRPAAADGYSACESATAGPHDIGVVGAGCGATIAKWNGREHRRPGGIGVATERYEKVVVAALLVVNAFGDAPDGTVRIPPTATGEAYANTTIGIIATNAALTKAECALVARSAHDGLARAIDPVHTAADGDAVIVAATGAVGADVEAVRTMAAHAVASAISSVMLR